MDYGLQEGKNQIKSMEEIMNIIIEEVCPIMNDLKVKIKIKVLDLLALLSSKTLKMEYIKNTLSSALNNTDY